MAWHACQPSQPTWESFQEYYYDPHLCVFPKPQKLQMYTVFINTCGSCEGSFKYNTRSPQDPSKRAASPIGQGSKSAKHENHSKVTPTWLPKVTKITSESSQERPQTLPRVPYHWQGRPSSPQSLKITSKGRRKWVPTNTKVVESTPRMREGWANELQCR